MSSNLKKKVEKIKLRTEEVRKAFNYPETETVIQDYFCNYNYKQGRLYITQSYISFLPSIGTSGSISIPFRKIVSIQKEKNLLVFDNAFSVKSDNGQSFLFSAIVHRDEAYNLVEYLWKHPVSYIQEEDDDNLIKLNKNRKESLKTSLSKMPLKNTDIETKNDDVSISSLKEQQQIKVDTQTPQNLKKLAYEAREIGTSALNELTIQAEQIDRIEQNVESIHNNLDKANRLLRGMESIPGTIVNGLTKDIKGVPSNKIDRTIEIYKPPPEPIDVDILEKTPSDYLQPAILRLDEVKFMILDPVTKKPHKNSIFSYEDIEQIVMRARHQHLDIRFKNGNRIRMCTSFIQGIVNEFFLRNKKIEIKFEPGTRSFPYGKPEFSIQSMISSKRDRSGSGFYRKNISNNPKSLTKTIFRDASEDVKKQVEQQEKDLDEISNIVNDLTAIAITIGNEIDRSNEQLDKITDKVDLANERLSKTNHRIDQLL